MPYTILQFGDFYSSLTSVWLTAFIVAKPSVSEEISSAISIAGAVAIAMAVHYNPTSFASFIVPIVCGLILIIVCWVTFIVKCGFMLIMLTANFVFFFLRRFITVFRWNLVIRANLIVWKRFYPVYYSPWLDSSVLPFWKQKTTTSMFIAFGTYRLL